MANYIKPDVYVTEVDLSQVVPSPINWKEFVEEFCDELKTLLLDDIGLAPTSSMIDVWAESRPMMTIKFFSDFVEVESRIHFSTQGVVDAYKSKITRFEYSNESIVNDVAIVICDIYRQFKCRSLKERARISTHVVKSEAELITLYGLPRRTLGD